jgi:hypothetical protein
MREEVRERERVNRQNSESGYLNVAVLIFRHSYQISNDDFTYAKSVKNTFFRKSDIKQQKI